MDNVKIGDCQPCPFCGTPNDIELSRVDVQDREGFPVAMSCATCGCVGPWDYCPVSDEIYWLATAIHKWNQQSALNELTQLRAERDALKARVEELENIGERIGRARLLLDGDFSQALDDLERLLNTTPGGDE